MRLPFEFHSAMSGAEPLRSRKGVKAVLQRAGTREAGSERPYLSKKEKPSVQPPAKRIAGVAIGERDWEGKRGSNHGIVTSLQGMARLEPHRRPDGNKDKMLNE